MTTPAPRRTGGLGRGLGALIPTTAAEPVDDQRRRARAAPQVGGRARASPSCRWTRSPRTRCSRGTHFDEEALAELVHSISEVGLLQPVVVREIGPGPLRAGHGRAAAGAPRRPAGHRHDPGDRARHQRRRHAARRAAGEPAPPAAQPARGGGRLPAAAAGVRSDARGAGRPDRPVASADLQHHPPAAAARRPCSAGSPPASCPPGTPARSSGCRRRRRRRRWPPASSPRACRCGRSRRPCSSRTARRPRTTPPRGPARSARCPRSWSRWPTGCATASRPG